MSVWPITKELPILHGVEGDLLSVRVTVEAFWLEDLLETLAAAPFPINPEIHHHAVLDRDGRPVPAVHVEFPAWRQRIPEIHRLLDNSRFHPKLEITNMLEVVR